MDAQGRATRLGDDSAALLTQLFDGRFGGTERSLLRIEIVLGLDALLLDFEIRLPRDEVDADSVQDSASLRDQRQCLLEFFPEPWRVPSRSARLRARVVVDEADLRALLGDLLVEQGVLEVR